MKTIKLSDIIISEEFLNSHPSEYKIEKYRDVYNFHKQQKKCVVLNDNNVLVDGYIQYLVLKENNVDEVKYIRENEAGQRNIPFGGYKENLTTYVYGIHPNSKCKKEYMWRVPNGWSEFADKIGVGDIIYCNTKFGISPVEITKIEKHTTCPTNSSVRKVANKNITHKNK